MDEYLICCMCKESLHKSEFSLRSTLTGKRSASCKKCHAAYRKEHYKNNKEEYKRKAKEWAQDNPEKRKRITRQSTSKLNKLAKQMAVDYKGGKCQDCEGIFPNCCYDFHHLDPKQKDVHVASSLNGRGFEATKVELDKCVLLCANCHRIRHHVKPTP